MSWRHIDSWASVAGELGLNVAGPLTLSIGDAVIDVDLLINGFGGVRGMVVASGAGVIHLHGAALQSAGYGYTSFGPPQAGECLDREAAIALLRDWTWTGFADEAPAWLSSS